ncbi:MAG TPA: hypothetical protein VFM37_15785 [Pseudonocardiaceae bacterium]|nr:hypothetical protein [Pseudonocardiaceae bacterium]
MAEPRSTLAPGMRDTGLTDVDRLVAQYDEELPARNLTGWVSTVVTLACFATSAFVLKQVFAPLASGNQFYLILFLSFVLPLIFLCYRPLVRRRTSEEPTRSEEPADRALKELGAS